MKSMESYESSEKYIISLDTVDLSILPSLKISPKHYDVTMPIWSNSNLKLRSEDCYYEFEVKDEEDISDTDTFVSSSDNLSCPEIDLDTKTNLCYLCNLEVPLPYMKEHINSPKHKAFLKIAEIALERVKKQMSQNYETENHIPSMFFCQTCVVVVPFKNRSLHLKSNIHKNAMILDRLLNNLLMLYSDEALDTDDRVEYESETPKCDELDKIINKTLKANVTKKSKDANVTDVEFPVKLNNDDAKEAIYDENSVNSFENVNKDSSVNGDQNMTNYLNVLNTYTVASHTLEDINGEYLKIETKNANSFKVKYDKFHGIVRIGDRHLQCKLCTEIIKNKKEHIYSTKHMEKLTLPIKDKQCIREMGQTKSHCILCNDLIENADIHARCDAVHNAHFKKAIIIPVEDIKSRSKNTVFENVKSDDFLQKKQGADQADNNKVYVRKTEPKIPVIALHEKENVKQNEALLEKHSAIKAVDVNSKKNVLGNEDEKQNELLEDGIVQAGDNNISLERKEFFCSVCYIKIHANDLHSHASGAKHKLNEKLDFHYLLEYSTETNEIKCKICNTFFHTKLINVHVMNSDHAYNYNALLAANKMMKKENNINCDACVASMRVGNELLHINSAKHKMLLLKTKAPISKPITESVCEKVKEKNDTQHFCDVCQALVPNNAYNISTHYNGSRHKKNFAIHLSGKVTEQGNDKIVQADKNTVGQSSNASDKTKIPVERNATEETVLEKRQNKFDSYKAAVNSRAILDEGMQGEKNNKLVAVANEEKTTAGKEAHKLYNVTQKTSGNDNTTTAPASAETVGGFFEITSNPKELMCRICNVIIPNKSMNVSEHLAGYNHCNNFTILMEQNQLQLVGNSYFCNHCRVYVTIGNQFNHISERTHVVNVAKTVANMLVEVFVQKSDSATDIKSANDSSSNVQTPSTSNVSAQCSSASQPKIHTYFEMKLSDKPYEVLCQVCNVKVSNSVSTLNMHVEGQRHNAQLKEILLKNKITEEDGRFKCSACFMDLSRFELFKHIRKNYHLTSLEKNESNCIVNGYCNVCDESISDGKMDEHILTEQHLTNQKQKTQSINHVCEICDVQLTNNISNINEHNNGFQHKNIIKIMDENNIEIREGKCYCKSCEVYITYKSIQGHVGMSQHLILMGSDVSQ